MIEVNQEGRLNVTVAIILHGEPPKITATIRSVLSQQYILGRITILCLDDGTSPNARSLVAALGLWIVDLPCGSSISVAKNIAIRLSTDEFVFFLDDHICLEPNGLEPAMSEFLRDPDLAGVCGFYRSATNSDWNTIRDIKRHSIYRKSVQRRLITLEDFTTFSTGIGIVRRSIFLSLDFPEREFPPGFGGEDVPALLVALNHGHHFSFVPNLSGTHEHNLSLREFIGKMEVEVRGRFSVFHWASGFPNISVPYLHGFLNFPITFYIALIVGVSLCLLGLEWALVLPLAFLLVEIGLSLRCLMTPIHYPLKLRLLAALYVLASDLLTPVCALQYAVSSYKRPFANVTIDRATVFARMIVRWELQKYGLARTASASRNVFKASLGGTATEPFASSANDEGK
jgi:glycosyltransferase involved in cell wall biosynthesis